MNLKVVSYFIDVLNVSHLCIKDMKIYHTFIIFKGLNIKIFEDIPKSFSIQQRNQENINIKIYTITPTKMGSHGT